MHRGSRMSNKEMAETLKKSIQEFGDPSGALEKLIAKLMKNPNYVQPTVEEVRGKWEKKLKKGLSGKEIELFISDLEEAIRGPR